MIPLIRDGWLRDAHPPLFNAWATLLASLGVDSIAAGRLVSNGLAATAMLLAARSLSRRMPELAGFNMIVLLLTLSLPQAMDAFASYRSYFWQIAAMGTLVMVARHVASVKSDLDLRKDVDLAMIAGLATVASIDLHYIGALFGGLLAGAIALFAFARGLRRWAALMLASAGLASLLIVVSVALQISNWAEEFDHSWIDLPGFEALGVIGAVVVGAIVHNPVPLLGLWIGRTRGDASERRFAAMIASVLTVGVAIVLAAHAFKPIVVDRYLLAVPVLICGLMAVPAARIARDSLPFGLLVLVSVAVAAGPMVERGIKPLWREGARTVAGIVKSCPATRVFAASGWAVGPAYETRTARREDAVFERAYRVLARDHGFAVEYIGQNGVAHASPGACPVVLWFEHTPNEAEDDLPAAVDAAGLSGLQAARLSVVRTGTGFVIRADRP